MCWTGLVIYKFDWFIQIHIWHSTFISTVALHILLRTAQWFSHPKMVSNWSQKWSQNRPKMEQNGAHMGVRWAPDGSRGLMMAKTGSKMATRRLQDVPRWLQEAPRWLQDGLIGRHEAPKMAPRAIHEGQMGCQNGHTKQNREFQKKKKFPTFFQRK